MTWFDAGAAIQSAMDDQRLRDIWVMPWPDADPNGEQFTNPTGTMIDAVPLVVRRATKEDA